MNVPSWSLRHSSKSFSGVICLNSSNLAASSADSDDICALHAPGRGISLILLRVSLDDQPLPAAASYFCPTLEPQTTLCDGIMRFIESARVHEWVYYGRFPLAPSRDFAKHLSLQSSSLVVFPFSPSPLTAPQPLQGRPGPGQGRQRGTRRGASGSSGGSP